MRKIDILNKDYEKVELDTVVYKNKTIDEVCYVDSDGKAYKYSDVFDGDFNDVVKNATGWTAQFVLTVTQEFSKDLSALGYKIPILNSTKVKIIMKIGVITFTIVDRSTLSSTDTENLAAIDNAGRLILRVNKTTYPDTASFEAYLQANDVEFIFEKSTFIPIAEPSKTQYDNFIETYKSRHKITKETYTLREFMELNLFENGFFEDGEEGWSGNFTFVGDKYYYPDDFTLQIGQTISLIKDNSYYLSMDIETESTGNISFLNTAGSLLVLKDWADYNNGNHSFITNSINDTDTLSIYARSVGSAFYIDNLILITQNNFDEYMTKDNMDYIVALYKKVKYEIKNSNKTYYKGSGISKVDIAYRNKTIDEVVYEGKTLRDIFEHGNLVKNEEFDIDYSEWTLAGSTGIISNGILILTGTGGAYNYIRVEQQNVVSVVIGEEFYIMSKAKLDNAIGNILLRAYDGTKTLIATTISIPVADKWYNMSGIITIENIGSMNINAASFYVDATEQTGKQLEVDYIRAINLSIFTVNPTVEQMDTWRDMYLARKDLLQVELTYSDIFEKSNIVDMENDHWADSGVFHDLENKELLVENLSTSVGYITYNDSISIEFQKKYFFSIETKPINKANFINYISGALDGSTGGTNQTLFNDYVLDDLFLINSIIVSVASDFTGSLIIKFYILPLSSEIGQKVIFKEFFLIDTSIFDERITQSQLDIMLAQFKIIRNVIVEPEVFLITDPSGFGIRAKMLTIDDYVYGHKVEYEKLQFKMNFGINHNAYGGYNLMMKMLKDNEAIIEYNWGDGSRFADVRLVRAPKTEKDTFSLLREKWEWERLSPFYQLKETGISDTIINSHNKDLELRLELTVDSTSVLLTMKIEGENDQEIGFDFNGVSVPFNLIIDAEKKTITKDDGTNMYGYLDFSLNSFFIVPEDKTVNNFEELNASNLKIKYKQWVVD